jgi:hemerythrin|tara:strand:- start:198 stop:536 length:339 start_codon:yes stop_codon:yes gene_type:complete
MFYLINDLSNKQSIGVFPASHSLMFYSLVNYIEAHFDHEERLMEECYYLDIQTHKQTHKALDPQVRDFQSEFMSNLYSFVHQALIKFLTNWLKNHISKVDMKFTEFYKTRHN